MIKALLQYLLLLKIDASYHLLMIYFLLQGPMIMKVMMKAIGCFILPMS